MIIEHALAATWPRVAKPSTRRRSTAALPIIESAPGCRGAEVRRQVEDPSAYLLLVRWDSVEAHLAFRETGLFDDLERADPRLLRRHPGGDALQRAAGALARAVHPELGAQHVGDLAQRRARARAAFIG